MTRKKLFFFSPKNKRKLEFLLIVGKGPSLNLSVPNFIPLTFSPNYIPSPIIFSPESSPKFHPPCILSPNSSPWLSQLYPSQILSQISFTSFSLNCPYPTLLPYTLLFIPGFLPNLPHLPSIPKFPEPSIPLFGWVRGFQGVNGNNDRTESSPSNADVGNSLSTARGIAFVSYDFLRAPGFPVYEFLRSEIFNWKKLHWIFGTLKRIFCSLHLKVFF